MRAFDHLSGRHLGGDNVWKKPDSTHFSGYPDARLRRPQQKPREFRKKLLAAVDRAEPALPPRFLPVRKGISALCARTNLTSSQIIPKREM